MHLWWMTFIQMMAVRKVYKRDRYHIHVNNCIHRLFHLSLAMVRSARARFMLHRSIVNTSVSVHHEWRTVARWWKVQITEAARCHRIHLQPLKEEKVKSQEHSVETLWNSCHVIVQVQMVHAIVKGHTVTLQWLDDSLQCEKRQEFNDNRWVRERERNESMNRERERDWMNRDSFSRVTECLLSI